ncbi:hypothetical protein NQ314_014974 [Rhamnusium bicolor]|uniref:LSM domain-containing protein n=1 Tax=Rhamnusium bicolor TaxID=1586634 RepID=A0AAV8WZZ3_9CUCU|nr:hypothetical protein NQ314_014974 [Rhamnusium bicolor]
MAEGDSAETVHNSRSASKRDIFGYYNTLSGLVKGLEGKYTTIDLRNECCVTGKIIKVDGGMNVEMRDVIFYDSRGGEQLIEGQLTQLMAPSKAVKEKRTFKTLRAERYNKEIVQSVFVDKSST